MDDLLNLKKSEILQLVWSWKDLVAKAPNCTVNSATKQVFSNIGFTIVQQVGYEIDYSSLTFEIIGKGIDHVLRKGFRDNDAAEFLRLYIKTLNICLQVGEDIDWSQSLSNGLLLFKRDILPAVFASLSPNLASLAVKYIFDTIFRHFHLYSLVLGDEAVIVTNQIVVEVATVKSIPELEKGVPEEEWALEEKVQTFEENHARKLQELQMKELTHNSTNISDLISTSERLGSSTVFSLVDEFAKTRLEEVSAELDIRLKVFQANVDCKAAITETVLQHKVARQSLSPSKFPS